MTTFADTWQIARKDLLEFARDRLRLATFVIMPIFMMVMTGFIFPSQTSIRNVPIGVVNQDPQLGRALVGILADFEMARGVRAFRVRSYPTVDAVRDAIRRQDCSGGVAIPAGFSDTLRAGRPAEVTIIEDQSNPQISAITTQTLVQLVARFGQAIGTRKLAAILVARQPVGAPPADPASFITPIRTRLEGLFSGHVDYFEFVAPGIIAMVVMTAVLTGLAASVSREREQGTLDGILIAPIGRLAIILGKAASQSIRGLAQGAIVLLLAIFLFGVRIHGNILLVALLLLLGIFSFVGLGILVSASAAEQETATQLLFMFQFPMLFLSGAFFPIQQMPGIMQTIAHFIPLTYAIEALRKVMILGAGVAAVRTELFILTLFGAATLAVAVPLFRRMITR